MTDVILELVEIALASQALTLSVSPSAALPAAILYRGALVCLPLTAVLRMAFRPKPHPSNNGFDAPGATAEETYRQAWRLNVLWLITFYGLIILNVSDKPNSLPDAILGNQIVVFGIWHAVQKDSLSTRGEWITLFANLRKRFAFGILLAEALWPWFSGQTAAADFRRRGGKYNCVRHYHSRGIASRSSTVRQPA